LPGGVENDSMADSVLPKEAVSPPGDPQDAYPLRPWRNPWPWLATLAVLALTAYQLHRQGRGWCCACGQLSLSWGDPRSPHTSQHLFDPYSFTHVLHGLALCGLLAWAVPRLAPVWRLWLAICLECLWEVFENIDFVIQRYRTATVSFGYPGDTVANSLGDILSSAVGFVLARRLGLWGSLALFVLIEAVLLVWIRDSLLLNVVMLIHPIDAIKAWQMGH
jgi:hypothetical protein